MKQTQGGSTRIKIWHFHWDITHPRGLCATNEIHNSPLGWGQIECFVYIEWLAHGRNILLELFQKCVIHTKLDIHVFIITAPLCTEYSLVASSETIFPALSTTSIFLMTIGPSQWFIVSRRVHVIKNAEKLPIWRIFN